MVCTEKYGGINLSVNVRACSAKHRGCPLTFDKLCQLARLISFYTLEITNY